MNLVEVYVTNITEHYKEDGLHRITADFNCYGRMEYQKSKWITEQDYKMIMEKGYCLA